MYTHSLTPRQTEVLTMFAQGIHYKAIADKLGVGDSCVSAHRKAILSRLEANSTTHAVAIAIKMRLVDIGVI